MRMFGAKNVVGKQLTQIIIDDMKGHDFSEYTYIEPFCGVCGTLKYMAPLFKKVYANDICKDLILLHRELKANTFVNPKITREKWTKLKYSSTPSSERAMAGFGCSFGGVFFNGYIDDPKNNDMEYSSLIRLAPKLQNVIFSCKDYFEFLKGIVNTSKKYVIYLDPPYKNTCCLPWPEFDSTKFWNVCRALGKMKNIKLYVSELSAPKDFKCIYCFKRRNGLHNVGTGNIIIEEKLYTI